MEILILTRSFFLVPPAISFTRDIRRAARIGPGGGYRLPIVGVARSAWTSDQLRARARESLEEKGIFEPQAFEELAGLLQYVSGDYGAPETYARIRAVVGEVHHPLFYMAVPPSVFPVVTGALAASGWSEGARVVREALRSRSCFSARS